MPLRPQTLANTPIRPDHRCLGAAGTTAAERLLWLLPLLAMLAAVGCSRSHYSIRADRDAYDVIAAANHDPRWSLPDYSVYPDARSRFASEWPVDWPAMPPDDPTAHKYMEVVDNKKAFAWDKKFAHTPFVENPAWGKFLPLDENGCLVLQREQDAVQVALLNNRDYQEQLEQLYLSALDVSFERFRFDAQFFGGNSIFYTADGRVRSGREPGSSTLDVDSFLRMEKMFASGGQLVVGFANSMLWEYAGPNRHTPNTILNFAFVQPLLRFGNRAQVLERLTLSERLLLNNVRSMELYRRGFYVDIVTGRNNTFGPNRRGGLFGGAGLEGFSGVGGGFGRVGGIGGPGGGGGFAGGAGAASAGGYLGLLQTQREIANQQDNVDQLCGSLRLMEEFFAAGRIDRLQLQLTRQSLYNAESRLKSAEAAYESTLDQFKIDLGLPPEMCLRPDDKLLEKFELIRPELLDLRNRALLLRARMAVGPPRPLPPLNPDLADSPEDAQLPPPAQGGPLLGRQDPEELPPPVAERGNNNATDPFSSPQPDLDRRALEIQRRAAELARLIEEAELAVKVLDRARFLDIATDSMNNAGFLGGTATTAGTTMFLAQRPSSLKQLQDDFQTIADSLDPTKGLLKQLQRLMNFPYAVRVAPILQRESCEKFGQVQETFEALQAAKDDRIRTLRALNESELQVRCDELAREAFGVEAFLKRVRALEVQVETADEMLCGTIPWERFEAMLEREFERLPQLDDRLQEYFGRVRPLLRELDQTSETGFIQLGAPEAVRQDAQRRFRAAVEDLRRVPLTPLREQLEQFVAPLTTTLDEVQNELDELAHQSSNLMLIDARSALEQIELERVEMDEHEAFTLAENQRLDWMNARASLVDAWRLITFNAKNLQGDLNVVFNGDIQNTGDNPFRLRSSNGRLQVGLEFDAPLTRLAERNVYRQSLIDYQQARRSYMQFVDNIRALLRNELRTMRLNELNFELRRQAINVALDQVDLAQEGLFKPPRDETQTELGATAARDLVSALSDLLSVQNDFLSVWVNYEVQRRNLDLDLGTMRLDAEGNWIDPGKDVGRVMLDPWCPPETPLLRRGEEFVPLMEELPPMEGDGRLPELREVSWQTASADQTPSMHAAPANGHGGQYGAARHRGMPHHRGSGQQPSSAEHSRQRSPIDRPPDPPRRGLMGSQPARLFR